MKYVVVLFALLVSACASSSNTVNVPYVSDAAVTPPSGMIKSIISKPDGPGPFPAIILMHGCGGINQYSLAALTSYAKHFNSLGYVAVIPDSFSARTGRDVCTDATIVSVLDRTDDAYTILHYLNQSGYVIPNRVYVLGQSHGAGTVLNIAESNPRHDEHFAGGIALYPWCPSGPNPTKFPLLVLMGGRDSWTPAGRCNEYAARLQNSGRTIEYHVYPEAAHAYDMAGNSRMDHGHLLGWDGEAAMDTLERIDAFLARNNK